MAFILVCDVSKSLSSCCRIPFPLPHSLIKQIWRVNPCADFAGERTGRRSVHYHGAACQKIIAFAPSCVEAASRTSV